MNIRDQVAEKNETAVQIKQLLEQSDDGLYVANLQTNQWEYLSPAIEAVTGFSPDELNAMGVEGVRERIHPEDRERYIAGIHKMLEQGGSEIVEYRWQRKDGTYHWLNNNRRIIRVEQDQIPLLTGTVRDVTERKEAEILLQEVLENSRDMIFRRNIATGRYDYVSPSSTTTIGFTPEELMSMNFDEVMAHFHPDDVERFLEHNRALESSPEAHPTDTVEFRWKAKGGVYRWYSISRRLMRDAAGQPIAHVGTLRDITEQKRVEQEREELLHRLQVERAELEGVLDALPVGVHIADMSGRVIHHNHAVEEIWGGVPNLTEMPEGEAPYKAWQCDTGERVQATEWGLSRAIAYGEVTRAEELAIETCDGRRKTILNYARPIRDENGQPVGAVAVNVDITEQKEAERRLQELNDTLEQRVAERTEQLRAMAAELTQTEERERRTLAQNLHDHLQQLLAAARISVNIMQSRAEDELQAEGLNQVDALLGESISETRSLTAELSPTVLYDAGLAPGLQWLGERMQKQHGLKVTVDAEDLGNRAPEELRVVLFRAARELLFNVVKHAQVDQAEVRMRRVPGGEIELQVSDNGVGFDLAKLSRPIEEGFGLFSIRERIESMGGRMEVESAPGQGTRVTLRLPLRLEEAPPKRERKVPFFREEEATELFPEEKPTEARPPLPEIEIVEGPPPEEAPPQPEAVAPEEAVPPEERPAEGPPEPEKPVRVLLVDDHQIVRQGLVHLLADETGIEVVGEAGDGKGAVALARMMQPDVVLMDVSMPGMDGVEATRRITSEMPQTKVIGLSMHEGGEMARKMREAGAVDYMPKGGDPATLVWAIRQWAKRKD
ncbi:MAG: PAS domain S-box protein [Chloroflexi bacterium]|nr:PAS domain S-box protein [Chloroflexota bacterium]